MTSTIAFLPGDGVGPEVAHAAQLVMMAAAEKFEIDLTFVERPFGGAAIDEFGDPFPAATKQACLEADAIFLGAVGGPKWDGADIRPEAGLLALRKKLGVFANLRPIQVHAGLEALSPLKEGNVKGVDILIVRELTGGVYFGDREEGREVARDICTYSREEVERVARVAFASAKERRSKVTSVDKANVLATSRLWRATVNDLHSREYPDIELEHVLVDAMAMKLIQTPASYDVVLTENMFGDILSDEASVIAGSIGLAPSASLGAGRPGLYEPIHGSAPDIAGQDKANPVGAILSAAMMFRHSLKAHEAALRIEAVVGDALSAGVGTADIGGSANCLDVAKAIASSI
ncbi:MAG: 3-isopropylmalate dehydrogenase [Pseudomonadota bacterium]